MPIVVACPSCGSRLTAPDAAAGRTVKCPKCQSPMALPADEGFDVVDEPPSRRAVVAEEPVRARPRAVVEEDDEDDCPRRRRHEEEDEDDRPRKRKAKKKAEPGFLSHPAVLAVGGLIGCGLAGLFLYNLQRELQKETDKENNPRPAAVQPTGPAGWVTFSVPDSRIAVKVPGDFMQMPVPGGEQRAGVGTAVAWGANSGGKAFQLVIITPTNGWPADRPADVFLDRFAEGFTAGANVSSRSAVTVGGQTGREVAFRQAPHNAISRFTIVGGQVYVLSVVSTGPVSPTDPDVVAYFESAQFRG